MGIIVNALSSAAVRSERRALVKRVTKTNKQNRCVTNIHTKIPSEILADDIGSMIISGGEADIRDCIILEQCRQCAAQEVGVIVIHEGNYNIEHMLSNSFKKKRYCRAINSANPYYDPAFGLKDSEIASLFSEAALEQPIPKDYLNVVISLVRARGIEPYTKILMNCPHSSLDRVIESCEEQGLITTQESDEYKKIISEANASSFFTELSKQCNIIADRSGLAKATSIADCVKNGGVMTLDVSSFSNTELLSLISADIKRAAAAGKRFRVILDKTSLNECGRLADTIRHTDELIWTLSTSDICAVGELPLWLSRSHRVLLFSHSEESSENLSHQLGECEQLEIHDTGGLSERFSTVSTMASRVPPEEIMSLKRIPNSKAQEFFLIDNYKDTISRGTLFV